MDGAIIGAIELEEPALKDAQYERRETSMPEHLSLHLFCIFNRLKISIRDNNSEKSRNYRFKYFKIKSSVNTRIPNFKDTFRRGRIYGALSLIKKDFCLLLWLIRILFLFLFLNFGFLSPSYGFGWCGIILHDIGMLLHIPVWAGIHGLWTRSFHASHHLLRINIRTKFRLPFKQNNNSEGPNFGIDKLNLGLGTNLRKWSAIVAIFAPSFKSR